MPVAAPPLLIAFAGQSNMLGHKDATDGDKVRNTRIFVRAPDATAGGWKTAAHGDPPFNTAPGEPNNAALHVADHLQKETGRDVYLVGCPVNGSTLLSWSSPKARNMTRLLELIEDATDSPELRAAQVPALDAFLWHQGESDDAGATMVTEPKCDTLETYSREFHAMIDHLRANSWWDEQRTRLIAGELVKDGWLSARNDFYADPAQWSDIREMSVIPSAGLEDIGDGAHYSGAALQEMGYRISASLLSEIGAPKIHRTRERHA